MGNTFTSIPFGPKDAERKRSKFPAQSCAFVGGSRFAPEPFRSGPFTARHSFANRRIEGTALSRKGVGNEEAWPRVGTSVPTCGYVCGSVKPGRVVERAVYGG